MASLISSGTFINTGNCSFSGDAIVSRATFVSCIHNNGSCAGSTYSILTYSQMVACRVLYTLETYTFSGTISYGSTGGGTAPLTVTINNATYPVTFSSYILGSYCTIAAEVGSTLLSMSPGYVYTGGATGALIVNYTTTSGHSCTVTSGSVTYYH
jgi:hypothetical protein